ncbi:nicotinamide riboside transporter PnuC [Alteromonas sp. ASW11-36]|uniref:Nicotinamide riboside transporter PnuC n=1 Tax=Alteromonas arenosi TaxID=3055817 RepID=A0ABT7SSE9_9ALTE|nr:nicotinamide riboside transporter PnuC [Alteromonas sp. ASW11-36]MDM7859111.1 nicotinamide riboside transporter PnuC [Alteromonas sp. ASW11-36]
MSIQEFISGFLGASTLEIIASFSGFLCLYMLIKRNIWCWFFGFIQVTLYTYIFFHAKLYSDAGLHVVYMFLQIYGWWNWRHHQSTQEQLIVESGPAILIVRWALIAIVAAGVLGAMMDTYTDASFAYPDAFTTSTSLVAQWLLTRRYIFNWLFWIVVDIVAIYIYLQKGLYPTAMLYCTFLIMCIFGYKSWLLQYKTQTTAAN